METQLSRGARGSPLEIGAGPLAGRYDALLCLTDLETDDLLALRMLAPRCRSLPFHVVVGEGDQDKATLASQILGQYGFEDASVVRGVGSDRAYPADVLGAYGQAPRAAPIVAGLATDAIRRVLGEAESPLLVVLKPPLELLEMGQPGDAALLAKAGCVVYGSFNFRRVLEVHPEDGESRLQALLAGCKTAVVAERGPAVGSEATLHKGNTAFGAFDPSLLEVMHAWNAISARNLSASVAKDSAALVEAAAASDHGEMAKLCVRIARRAGVCRCIGEAAGQQIAAADPIVAALLLSPEALAPFLVPSSFVVNEHAALVWSAAGAGGSSVHCLVGEGAEQKQEILREVCRVIDATAASPL